MRRSSSSGAVSLVSPMIAIIGDVSEVHAATARLGVRAEQHDSATLDDASIIGVIVDLRGIKLDRAIEIRRSNRLANFPALVLTEQTIGDEVVVALDAVEMVRVPMSDRALLRTLTWFIELGALKLTSTLRDNEARQARERHRIERITEMATLAGGLAHEIRNPLAAIRSIAEQLADDVDASSPHHPHLTHILQAVERLEQTVSISLRLAAPSEPCLGLHRPWTIVARAVTDARARSPISTSGLRVHVQPELSAVLCDQLQIARAIGELIDNAIEASGSSAAVSIRVSAISIDDDRYDGAAVPHIHFDVRDEGPGMDETTLARVFDPFFTTSPNKTGLGLSIAQQIIVQNGACVEARSRKGGPTSFTITMPVASDDEPPAHDRRED